MYVNDRDEINYHGFLYALRISNDAKQMEVAGGLCSESSISRIELGERQPEKLLRDRISARLGVSGEEYEDYLIPEEYRQWKIRQRVLRAMDKKNFAKVEEGLKELEAARGKNKVQKQFIETMRYIMLSLQGADIKERRKSLRSALSFTVSNVKKALNGKHLLADQELNLILERIAIEEVPEKKNSLEWKMRGYEKVIEYIENSRMDTIGRSKLYPRIACHVSNLVLELDSDEKYHKRALEICDLAIEHLRRASRIYYFLEVLECHSTLLEKVKPYAYRKTMERDTIWFQLFLELYTEFGVRPLTENFCYFYWESECHDVSKVLEVRRHMKGLSRAKLCGEFCAEKTILRYEKNGVTPSMPVIREIFDRLSMCAEYKRARVITSNPETLQLANELVGIINNYDVKNGWIKINELRSKLNLNIIFNYQEILMMETMLHQMDNSLNEEELYSCIVAALESTVTFEDINRCPKKYLTRTELTSLSYLTFWARGEKSEDVFEFLNNMCQNVLNVEIRPGRVCVFEMLMPSVSSHLGNIGEYDISTALCKKMLKECLLYRRMYNIANDIYDISWNMQELSKINGAMFPSKETKEVLRKSVILSTLNYETNIAAFFQQKLDDLNVSV